MVWFRVDDSFPSHPKVRRIPRSARLAAIGTWTTLGAYSARQLTNGLIAADDVIDEGGTRAHANHLVAVGLWHPPGATCGHPTDECPGAPPAGHYQFHDWLVYQRSRDEVLAERAAAAKRQQRARERAKEKRHADDHERSNGVSHGVTAPVTGAVTAPVSHGPPDPTRPDPNKQLLALVCRRLSRNARTTTTDGEVDLWSEAAGGAHLESELRAWLIHNADTDLRDPGAALLGWLRAAAARHGPPVPGCQQCDRGWRGEDPETGRPVPCPTCRPHLRSVEAL